MASPPVLNWLAAAVRQLQLDVKNLQKISGSAEQHLPRRRVLSLAELLWDADGCLLQDACSALNADSQEFVPAVHRQSDVPAKCVAVAPTCAVRGPPGQCPCAGPSCDQSAVGGDSFDLAVEHLEQKVENVHEALNSLSKSCHDQLRELREGVQEDVACLAKEISESVVTEMSDILLDECHQSRQQLPDVALHESGNHEINDAEAACRMAKSLEVPHVVHGLVMDKLHKMLGPADFNNDPDLNGKLSHVALEIIEDCVNGDDYDDLGVICLAEMVLSQHYANANLE